MNIETAIQKTLVHEGGYTCNEADPGGATNFGIIQADMPGTDMRTITQEQAIEYYRQHYVKPLYAQIEDQLVGEKLFDMGVLFGVGTAVEILQKALAAFFPISIDGGFGAETLSAVNQSDGPSLLNAYKTLLVSHALGVANAHPPSRVFVAGWGRRINS